MGKYEPYKFKKCDIGRWWIFKARLFGKKIYGKDCNEVFCVETFGVIYKGITYIYKQSATQFKE